MNADMTSKDEQVIVEGAVAPSCRFEAVVAAERVTDRGREMLVVLNHLFASDATSVCDTRE